MTDTGPADAGTVETRQEAAPDNAALCRFWLNQISLAEKDEEGWRKRAQKVLDLYADSDRKKGKQSERFNILYSNVQTLAPALLPAVPKPDVRQRFRDKDPVATAAADMLERCAATQCDMYDFAQVARSAVLDRCLPGRAVVRIDYEISYADEAGTDVALQSVSPRQVMWDDFRRGPGRTWSEVTWIAFKHKLRREELEALAPDIGKKVELDLSPDGRDDRRDDDEQNVYKRAEVWEVWDKDTRKVIWIARSHKDAPLKVEDDTLRLSGFFPIPRPLYAIEQPDSLEPIEEYRQYEDQARELEKISRRIDKIVSGLKVRGMTASQIKELARVAKADDNEMIVAESGDAMAALSQGGLDKAIWMWPLDEAIKALQQLYVQREAIKQTIYEITGISDILRGQVDSREKLGQSQLKANWGSLRMEHAKAEVQRFLRDLVRIKTEIIAEHFEPAQLMMMSGLNLPTQAQVEQQAAMAHQQGQQPPEAPPVTLEAVMAIIRSDAMRTFRVDIETDASVAGDEQAEKQMMNEFVAGTVQYWTGMAPIIQGGFPKEVAVGLYQAAARRFNLGRDVDELLDDLSEAPVPPPQPEQGGPDPAAEQAKAQAEIQAKQAEAENKLKMMAAEDQRKEAEHRRAMEKLAIERDIKMIDKAVAELNAKVKTGEILVPPEAPEQPDPLDGELKKADIEVRRAQAGKMMREADAVGQETQERQDTTMALQAVTETLQQILARTEESNAAVVRALSAPRVVKTPRGEYRSEMVN